MERLIIGLVGRKGSGKGTVSRILKDRYRVSTFRFSDMLRDVLAAMRLEQSRENLIRVSQMLRKEFGEDVMQRTMIKNIEQDTAPVIVVDGIRRIEDLDHLDKLGTFRLVCLTAPMEIRYERMRQRGENAGESTNTFEAFKELENAPTEVSIGEVEARAWKSIDNAGNEKKLEESIIALMTDLGYANPRH